MKKILLLLAGVFAGISMTYAEDEVQQFSWSPADPAGTKVAYFYLDQYAGQTIGQAIRFKKEKAAGFIGNQITKIWFWNGVKQREDGTEDHPSHTSVDVFITKELGSDPLYSATVPVSKARERVWVELETPLTITAADDLYIGFNTTLVDADDHIKITDDIKEPGLQESYVTTMSGAWVPSDGTNGHNQIGIVIEGTNMPQDAAIFRQITPPEKADPTVPFTLPVNIQNMGATDISNITVSYIFGGGAQFTVKGNVIDPETRQPSTIAPGETGMVELPDLSCTHESLQAKMKLSLTMVNDKINIQEASAQAKTEITFPCFNKANGYPRNLVIEEGTSVDCGWCPRGTATLEYLSKTYPGTFLALAYHTDMSADKEDPMTSESGQAFHRKYARALPYAIVNRTGENVMNISNDLAPITDYLDKLYAEERENNTFVGVELDAYYTDPDNLNGVTVEAAVGFAVDLEYDAYDAYRVALAVVEDDVPADEAKQTNYYSNSSYKCGGWEERGRTVKLPYQHVVRDVYGFEGFENSIPAGLNKGQMYEFSEPISIAAVEGETCRIIAMIIDSKTEEIVNAAQLTFPPTDVNAIEAIDAKAEAVTVTPMAGGVAVSGCDSLVEAYNVQGQMVARRNGAGFMALPAGLYIVRAGETTVKVSINK